MSDADHAAEVCADVILCADGTIVALTLAGERFLGRRNVSFTVDVLDESGLRLAVET